MHHIRFKFLAAEAWKYFSNLHRIMFLTAPNTSSWCWRHELSVQMWKIFKFYERHETQICAGGRKGLHHFAMMILCLHATNSSAPNDMEIFDHLLLWFIKYFNYEKGLHRFWQISFKFLANSRLVITMEFVR